MLVRLECPGNAKHYICEECLDRIVQYNNEDGVRWKRCPICRASIKNAYKYNSLPRVPACSRDEYERIRSDPNFNRLRIHDRQLQGQQQPNAPQQVNDVINREQEIRRLEIDQIRRDAAREQLRYLNELIQLEREDLARVNRERTVQLEQLEQLQQQRERLSNRIVFIGGIIVYVVVHLSYRLLLGGGGPNNNGPNNNGPEYNGVIYIGSCNGIIGLWWSIIIENEVVTIPIVGTRQFSKIAERYYPGQNMKFEDIFKTNEITKKQGGSNKRRRRHGRLTKRRRR